MTAVATYSSLLDLHQARVHLPIKHLIPHASHHRKRSKRRPNASVLITSSSIPQPTFSFGGSTGSAICTVAFEKVLDTLNQPNGDEALVNGHGPEELYICVDVSQLSDTHLADLQCGGTTTDVAIASSHDGIVARAVGGTSNMAEVSSKRIVVRSPVRSAYNFRTTCELYRRDHSSANIDSVTATVLEGLRNLPPKMKKGLPKGQPNVAGVFADVWIGVSYRLYDMNLS